MIEDLPTKKLTHSVGWLSVISWGLGKDLVIFVAKVRIQGFEQSKNKIRKTNEVCLNYDLSNYDLSVYSRHIQSWFRCSICAKPTAGPTPSCVRRELCSTNAIWCATGSPESTALSRQTFTASTKTSTLDFYVLLTWSWCHKPILV